MSYVWEEEWIRPCVSQVDLRDFEWHLKKIVGKSERGNDLKISLAWVRKIDDRKWHATINSHNNDNKTFRSLKAAKAYAVAIITLDN